MLMPSTFLIGQNVCWLVFKEIAKYKDKWNQIVVVVSTKQLLGEHDINHVPFIIKILITNPHTYMLTILLLQCTSKWFALGLGAWCPQQYGGDGCKV